MSALFFRRTTLCFALFCLLRGSSTHAQIVTDDGAELVNAMTNFVIIALNSGSADAETFSFRGSTILVTVDVNGTISLFQNGQLQLQTDDLGEFVSFALGFLGDVPVLIEEILEEEDITDFIEEVTGTTITDTPGGPIDEVFSQILFGRGIFGRAFVDLDDQAAKEDEIAAVIRYTRFDNRGLGGNLYGITMGYERELEKLRYGVIIPYDRIDFDGLAEDADSFTITPFLQYIVMRDPLTISVGPYAFYNYTFLNDLDNPSLWGGGLGASIEKFFGPVALRGGTALEYIDANINVQKNTALRFRYGGSLGAPIIPDLLEGRVYLIHTIANKDFLQGDSNFASAGGELIARIGEAFTLTLGYIRSIDHDALSGDSLYLGGIFVLR